MNEKRQLPTIKAPTLNVTLPVSKIKAKYRPFIVKEQQALLLAQGSDDAESIYETIKSVIDTCTAGTVDLETLPLGDLSFLFIQLMIASQGPDIRLKIHCSNDECGKDYLVNLSLDQVQVKNADVDTKVMVTDTIGVKLRVPSYADAIFIDANKDDPISIMYRLTEYIYDQESIWNKSTDFTEDSFRNWVNDLTDAQVSKFNDFLLKNPDVSMDLTTKCPHCKTEHSKPMEGLQMFFRLGDD